MDPTVQAALIGAVGLAMMTGVGGLAGHLAGRRARRAGVELTEAQTADLETQVYERVIRTQEAERAKLAAEGVKLAARITELEAQVASLRALAAAREQELQRDLESTRAQLAMKEAELVSLRSQLAVKEVELSAARREAADLHLLVQVGASQA